MSEKITHQAAQVLETLQEENCHLTAEEILEKLPEACSATVYRSLERLVQLKQIRKLSLGKKQAVYELNRAPHLHFLCNGCGAIWDIPLDLSGIAREASAVGGHQAHWSESSVYGLCRNCVPAAQQDNA